MIRSVLQKLTRPRCTRRVRARTSQDSVEGLESRVLLFNPRGSTWGEQATVTYSYMPDGVQDTMDLNGGWTNTALATMETNGNMPPNFEGEIDRALETWSRVANIAFVEVADGGEDFGAAGPGDIRFGSYAMNGPGGQGAFGFFPPGLPDQPQGDTRWGDVHFDVADTFTIDPSGFNLFNFAMHELGHSIGLQHVEDLGIMDGTVETGANFFGVRLDDIQGAQLIYGPAVVGNLVISAADDPTPGDQADDGVDDTFVLTRRTETITNPDQDPVNLVTSRDVDVIDVTINGQFAFSVNRASLAAITIQGSGDRDIVDSTGIDFPIHFVGGLGNDRVTAGGGNDTLDGGTGNDVMYGGGGNDELFGRAGNDRMYGEAGEDTLSGSSNNDSLYGGSGNDTVYGGSGSDFLAGQNNNDRLEGGSGNDTLEGGNHQDRLYGYGDDDTLNGQAGNDSLYGGDGNDSMTGGTGTDVMHGQNDNDTVFGDAGNDTITGGNGNDVLHGGDNADDLNGNLGNDSLFGDDDDDVLQGSDGQDTVDGGAGNDVVKGGANDDTLIGGLGSDNVIGGSGLDTLYAGVPGDLYNPPSDFDTDILNGGSGDDIAMGLFDNDDELISIFDDQRS